MQLNKTQRTLLRYVFGYNDQTVCSAPPSKWGMPISKGTRDWDCAIDLANSGVATVYKRSNGFWYVRAHFHKNEGQEVEVYNPDTMQFVPVPRPTP